jgi:malate dehydrogenase
MQSQHKLGTNRMSIVAIIGAGPLGGALAQSLAERDRVSEVRLIDPEGRIADGKALDLLQSAPVEQFSTRLTAAQSYAAAAGAAVIVFADPIATGEIAGDAGLPIVRQIARLDADAPLLFAGGAARQLMAMTIGELRVAPRRVLGSAPLALESSVRALTAAILDVSPADLSIGIAGVPPHHAVIGWDAATAFHQPIGAILPAHQMAAMSARLPALWPPAPYALASAAARVAEALADGSRRRYTCFAAIDIADVGRNVIAAVPVEIRKGGMVQTLAPALSRHELTQFENGLR